MKTPAVLDPSEIVYAIREFTLRGDYSNHFDWDMSHKDAMEMIVAPLDLIWEHVNALGGIPPCPVVAKALDIIESFGGSDPAAKRGAVMPKINEAHDGNGIRYAGTIRGTSAPNEGAGG